MKTHPHISRVFDLLHNCIVPSNKDDVFAIKRGGTWHKYTAQEVLSIVNKVSHEFYGFGCSK